MENTIHPAAVVASDVSLGRANRVGAFAIIEGRVELGDRNWIGAHAVVGATPEVRAVDHFARDVSRGTGVRIGNGNVIREAAQVHAGWIGGTVVGDDCFIMNQAYLAHDVELGSRVTIASSVLLAGHVRVGDAANIGLGAVVHQRRVIGGGAMIGMGAVVTHDIPPFAKVYGNPARVRGVNRVAMERSGVSGDLVAELERQYADYSEDGLLGTIEAGELVDQSFATWAVWKRAN